MKRKPLFLAFALLLAVSAALIGVNWRLNNPSLSGADKEFRALVAGADSVEIQQNILEDSLSPIASLLPLADLDAEQTRQLIERLRLVDDSFHQFNPKPLVSLLLTFKRKGAPIHTFILWQNPGSNQLLDEDHELTRSKSHRIHPRFEKPLRQFLNTVAPKSIES